MEGFGPFEEDIAFTFTLVSSITNTTFNVDDAAQSLVLSSKRVELIAE